MEIKDRINEFRKNKKMNVSAFEIKAGLSNGCWASSSNLREETLLKIVKAFPEIDAEWLLRGTDKDSESKAIDKLIELCSLLAENFKQRDEIMSGLVSMVNKIEIVRQQKETPTNKKHNKK